MNWIKISSIKDLGLTDKQSINVLVYGVGPYGSMEIMIAEACKEGDFEEFLHIEESYPLKGITHFMLLPNPPGDEA